jgi:MFS family permease
MSQFTLLKKKRFGPFFWTQFYGAFNDNLFKNALLIMFAFSGASHLADKTPMMDAGTLVNLSAGLFILPFFLFSALAGQLADKYEKGYLIRLIKIVEIIIMTLAAIGFIFNLPLVLLALLFLMGTQSAFFGPVKYSILPQHLKKEELVGGNGMVEMGTFLAILLGTIAGGVLIAVNGGRYVVGGSIIILAIFGWIKSRGIPVAPAASPNLKITFNPLTETWKTISFTRENIVVFRSILGISWFWFYGATFLAQMPTLTEKVLLGNEHVVTLLLTLFSVGIGAGSLLCERLSNQRVELGLVPFGAIGLTLFALDLWWVASHLHPSGVSGFSAFLSQLTSWRILLDLLGIGLFGGFYIVPLYALIQQRSDEARRSQVIAGNNIINAFFMVTAAGMAIFLLKLGLTIPQLFLCVAIMNALVAIYIFSLVPEFLLRFFIWILVHLYFKINVTGSKHFPQEGRLIGMTEGKSFLDFALLSGISPRPTRFIMDHKLFNRPMVHYLFKGGRAVPQYDHQENPELWKKTLDILVQAMKEEEWICFLSPETKLLRDLLHELRIDDNAMTETLVSYQLKTKSPALPSGKLPRRFRSEIDILVHKKRLRDLLADNKPSNNMGPQ